MSSITVGNKLCLFVSFYISLIKFHIMFSKFTQNLPCKSPAALLDLLMLTDAFYEAWMGLYRCIVPF